MRVACTPCASNAARLPGPVTQARGALVPDAHKLMTSAGRAAKKWLTALLLTNIKASY